MEYRQLDRKSLGEKRGQNSCFIFGRSVKGNMEYRQLDRKLLGEKRGQISCFIFGSSWPLTFQYIIHSGYRTPRYDGLYICGTHIKKHKFI